MAVHAWIAWLGVVAIPDKAFWDLTLYRYWMWQGLEQGQWPALAGDWVYPAGATVPMLVAAVGGTGEGSGYAIAWSAMITVLDAVALAVLLHSPRPGRGPHPTAGAWCWLGVTLLLGPVAMGRLDAVVAPLVVVALVLALRSPRTSSALLTAGAWIKVAPGPLLLPVVLAARRPWRDVVLPAAAVSAVVVGSVLVGGGGTHLLSFLGEQDGRGLQLESVGGTPWLVAALWTPQVERTYNAQIVTFELHGPGAQGMADVLGALFALGLLACAALLWWVRRRAGAAFWDDAELRAAFVVRGAMLIATALIVLNKVGSPQYIGWLGPPVAVALALGLPGWRRTAALVLGIAAATQGVFPWGYDWILGGTPSVTLVLVARNVALVVLLVHSARELVREVVRRPATHHPLEASAQL
ncbi:glycosyltransferase 87 family protein [Cellulomonas soli]